MDRKSEVCKQNITDFRPTKNNNFTVSEFPEMSNPMQDMSREYWLLLRFQG